MITAAACAVNEVSLAGSSHLLFRENCQRIHFFKLVMMLQGKFT